MTHASAPVSRLQALAARWRIWGQVLVALARHVTLAHKMQAHGGADTARAMEAVLFNALVQLSAEIATETSNTRALSAADRDALDHLKTVHAMLGVVTLMVRAIGASLEQMRAAIAARSGATSPARAMVRRPHGARTRQLYTFAPP